MSDNIYGIYSGSGGTESSTSVAVDSAGNSTSLVVNSDGYLEVTNPYTDNSITLSQRMQEINPPETKVVPNQLVDVTNGTDDTYYYTFNPKFKARAHANFYLDGGSGTVTVTCEAKIITGSDWTDVSEEFFGSVSGITADDYVHDVSSIAEAWEEARFKVVASTGGANDADWLIDLKQVGGY